LAQLRLVCLALGGLPIPDTLPICHVQEILDANGRARDPQLEKRGTALVRELLWYVEALLCQRRKFDAYERILT
jgi:hypothetical protein